MDFQKLFSNTFPMLIKNSVFILLPLFLLLACNKTEYNISSNTLK